MIPEFPKFKKLELSDKKGIEKFTSKFPHYSDFNFVSIWCWNIKDQTLISQFNNNLIVRFTDYITNKPFYSFLGDEKENETVEKMLDVFGKEGSDQVLRLISEEIGHKLSKSHFNLLPDKDSNDYIYSASHLSDMHNWPNHNLSRNIKNFLKLHPNHVIKQCKIQNTPKNECVEVFKKWAENKNIGHYSKLNEYIALERIFDLKYDNIYTILVYINNHLVGFDIYEILSSDYAISHFAKADSTHHFAINNILNWEEAKTLHEKGIKFINWEQDLGILGLRKSKEKHKPSFLFKKLIISKKD